jgi:hypothetical protein
VVSAENAESEDITEASDKENNLSNPPIESSIESSSGISGESEFHVPDTPMELKAVMEGAE